MPCTHPAFGHVLAAVLAAVLFAVAPITMATAQEQRLPPRKPDEADGALRWQFAAGDVYATITDQEMEISLRLGENEITRTRTETHVALRTEIGSVDDNGAAAAICSVTGIRVKAKGTSIDMEYDSASDDSDDESNLTPGLSAQLAKIVEPMIGKSMSQTNLPDGRIIDLRIPNEMMAGAADANEQLAAMFNRDMLAETITRGSVVFPAEQLKVGQTWTSQVDIETGAFPMQVETDYTYRGVVMAENRPMHLVDVDIRLAYTDPDPDDGTYILIVEQASEGEYLFDGVAGRLHRAELTQNAIMEISNNGPVLTQELQQKMTITLNGNVD